MGAIARLELRNETIACLTLPDVSRSVAVAAGRSPAFFDDVRLGARHLRMYVAPLSSGRAVVLAQPGKKKPARTTK